jgi:hypothetical protein
MLLLMLMLLMLVKNLTSLSWNASRGRYDMPDSLLGLEIVIPEPGKARRKSRSDRCYEAVAVLQACVVVK